MDEQPQHRPVLFDEALESLDIHSEGRYIDGTFGRGGHSRAILERLGSDGHLLAIDKDPEAITSALRQFGEDERFHIEQGSFAMLKQFSDKLGWTGRVDGILMDLGVSSPQLDQPDRGFSFMRQGPLDMRMDNQSGPTAAQWLASASREEISRVLKDYGEERFAWRIAGAIERERLLHPISTTLELAQIISDAVPRAEKGKHPATRSFQAIRIHINREIEDLEAALGQSLPVLAPGGRLVVISFHSLEDRPVKRFMRDGEKDPRYPAGVPVTQDQLHPLLRRVGKAIRPGKQELQHNPRARSSVLRVAERCG